MDTSLQMTTGAGDDELEQGDDDVQSGAADDGCESASEADLFSVRSRSASSPVPLLPSPASPPASDLQPPKKKRRFFNEEWKESYSWVR